MKKYFLLILFLSISINIFAQDNEESRLREKYEQLQKQIYDLEENAKYHGDDEIIRKRNDLPPKLPKFEEWLKSQVENKSLSDSKEDKSLSDNKEINNKNAEPIVNQNTVITNQSNSAPPLPSTPPNNINANTNLIVETCHTVIDKKGNARQICSLDLIEKSIEISLLLIFVVLNFTLYSNLKNFRFLVISTPFDLFARTKNDNSQTDKNYKKYLIEFILLLLFLFAYYILTNSKSIPDINYPFYALDCLIVLIISYFLYILLRFIFGFTSQCPSCRLQFASRLQNSHDEPRTTYQKRSGYRYSTGEYRMDNWESGVRVKDYHCFSCGYEWTKRSTYKKIV